MATTWDTQQVLALRLASPELPLWNFLQSYPPSTGVFISIFKSSSLLSAFEGFLPKVLLDDSKPEGHRNFGLYLWLHGRNSILATSPGDPVGAAAGHDRLCYSGLTSWNGLRGQKRQTRALSASHPWWRVSFLHTSRAS